MKTCLLPLKGDESITLSGPVTRRLLERGDGDAVMLYITILRHRGTVMPRSLAGELRWDKDRIEAAEQVLRELHLIAPPAADVAEPAEEKPTYSREDVAGSLEGDGIFKNLVSEVERKMGKQLTTPNVATLLDLYERLGLPADVIYLLVSHCVERVENRYGPGRKPGMKQIEREGYRWARKGIDTQAAASAYLVKYAERKKAIPLYMRALNLPERPPSTTEERYMNGWQEMGFPPETVAIAGDRTILKCQELKWPYCNGILKKWHEAGLHTPEQVAMGDTPKENRRAKTAPIEPVKRDRRKYIEQLQREDW